MNFNKRKCNISTYCKQNAYSNSWNKRGNKLERWYLFLTGKKTSVGIIRLSDNIENIYTALLSY